MSKVSSGPVRQLALIALAALLMALAMLAALLSAASVFAGGTKVGHTLVVSLAALAALLTVASVFAGGTKVGHALAGSIEKVDQGAKTLVIKKADGTEETLKWTEHTIIRGLKGAAKTVDLAGKEGEHVVVHYSVEGADKTAVAIKHLGRATPKVAGGTIESVGKGTRTLVVKKGDGAEETFHLADRAVVDAGEGLARGGESVGKKGAHVTVHRTEEAGRKVAHVIKRI